MYCKNCGKEIADNATYCANCGSQIRPQKPADANASPKSRLVSLLLCIFVGGLGVHRFYVGKVGTGLVWLFTGGVFGIGYIIDIILIACGSFTDKEGKFVSDWDLD